MSEVTLIESEKYIIICQYHNKDSRVCAGLSAVLQGLCWYLSRWDEMYEVEEDDGYLYIKFGKNFQCCTLFRYITEAVKGIEESYPGSILIREVN